MLVPPHALTSARQWPPVPGMEPPCTRLMREAALRASRWGSSSARLAPVPSAGLHREPLASGSLLPNRPPRCFRRTRRMRHWTAFGAPACPPEAGPAPVPGGGSWNAGSSLGSWGAQAGSEQSRVGEQEGKGLGLGGASAWPCPQRAPPAARAGLWAHEDEVGSPRGLAKATGGREQTWASWEQVGRPSVSPHGWGRGERALKEPGGLQSHSRGG